MNTPIYTKLLQLEKEKRIPFHMPGHKRRDTGIFFGMEKMDITEITGYDNLHQPKGIIWESMEVMREIFKTKRSWYLVGGSTLGIFAAISSVCRPGDKILIGRNCHKSVYNCIRLLRLEAVYCYPDISEEYDILKDIKPDDIRRILEKDRDIKAVVLTSPTYEGVVSDVQEIKKILLPYRIPLIVDEAHGAHFIFHGYFPKSAVECGADLVIQSTHKTLPSFTQTALLHLCSDFVSPEKIEDMLDIYETSSPSYLLLASAEYGVMYMHEKVDEVNKYVDNLENFRKKCGQLTNIKLMDKENLRCFDYDKGKLVFSVKGSGISGKQLFDILYSKYHIELEMENLTYGIAMTSVCDEEKDFEALWKALCEIDKKISTKIQKNMEKQENSQKNQKIVKKEDDYIVKKYTEGQEEQQKINKSVERREIEKKYLKNIEKNPEKVLESWECQDYYIKEVPLEVSVGKISGKYVMIYPPGSPILVPGEKIVKETVENISHYLYNGYNVFGLSDGQIFVLSKRRGQPE